MSRHETNVRYLQDVMTAPPNADGLGDECFSSDHTQDTANTFKLPGKNKMWNAATGFLKVLVCVLAASASSTAILHAAGCLAHREGFAPKVHFTDTWPDDADLWSALLPYTRGRLGVFHFMQRITNTLRAASNDRSICVPFLNSYLGRFHSEFQTELDDR